MTMRIRSAFLFVWLAAPLMAGDWIRLATPNFELYTTESEKQGREVLLRFEQVRNFFADAPESPVRIIAFSSHREFRPYAPNDSAIAFYVSKGANDCIVMEDLAPERLPVAMHEYVHLVLRRSGQSLPAWLEEGAAQVYSMWQPASQRRALSGKWIDLETITSVGHNSPLYNGGPEALLFYAESWALTSMLYRERPYAARFGEFLHALRDGMSFNEAAQAVFQRNTEAITAELHAWAERNLSAAGGGRPRFDAPTEDIRVAALSPYEADLLIADLHNVSNDRSSAKAAYERLASEAPANAAIPRLLGYLYWEEGDTAAARRWFHQALAAGTSDKLMCVQLAALDRDAGVSYSDVAAAYRRALELDPNYYDARYQFAWASMNVNEYEPALDALEGVRDVPAERADLYYNALAYAYLELGRRSEAHAAALKARQWAREPLQADIADQVLRRTESGT
jgi:tetratricopeptide (TPR) repeat protein